ncbi:MAG: endonuclease/exonuclease/phosphatase family protein [Mesorhizobium sp.]|uniref:endonuclease/exonuclease/phosphatase family protein n=1 Tax=Mesorhizobium sp. TaxID=1871066 RepID=UPI000FE9234B|nr:endonuclease/exonuclease/phosphatase family protein [Mesorhizobium sp.]RWM02583.1 MAG: endonuclease [Mesorhizobium sp.]TIO48171.1 MAG: endonuclease/exonuclease/phosphatase family protein [Mesorhizobium sp.]TIO56581.1 MAG: endonuclease/exonuclease/phosphatase family protein [Mesorhizobium sp.]TJV58018.1 MAG: endonuclease/exonuclease/phosphatase family protein [Mesorhizobium sp.]
MLVAQLTHVPIAERQAMREGPRDSATHLRHAAAIPALGEIEIGGKTSRGSAGASLAVMAWNVERLRHVDAIAATIAGQAPDVVLLSEVDKGMARSGNGHPLSRLADRLGHAFAYGVEFVELGAGNETERAAAGEAENAEGFHGNAVTSAMPLLRPFLVRLDAAGGWFRPERGQPRIGGRMAIGGQVLLGGRRVTIVSVHLENRTDPAGRADQTRHLLDAIDRYDAEAPVLIGGDFNTLTASHEERHDDPAAWLERIAAEPDRLIKVERHEPLFQVFAERGYGWQDANTLDRPTQRRAAGDPTPIGRIDWFFTRGLVASAPATLPALLPDGSPSSDHEALIVTVRLG